MQNEMSDQKTYSCEEFKNMTSDQLIDFVFKLRSDVEVYGTLMAEKNKAYKDIKELLPSKLAIIQSDYLAVGKNTSESKIRALANKIYRDEITLMNELGFEFQVAEVRYKASLRSLEAMQAITYVRNNELKLARHG